jgi:hypothetical protein
MKPVAEKQRVFLCLSGFNYLPWHITFIDDARGYAITSNFFTSSVFG